MTALRQVEAVGRRGPVPQALPVQPDLRRAGHLREQQRIPAFRKVDLRFVPHPAREPRMQPVHRLGAIRGHRRQRRVGEGDAPRGPFLPRRGVPGQGLGLRPGGQTVAQHQQLARLYSDLAGVPRGQQEACLLLAVIQHGGGEGLRRQGDGVGLPHILVEQHRQQALLPPVQVQVDIRAVRQRADGLGHVGGGVLPHGGERNHMHALRQPMDVPLPLAEALGQRVHKHHPAARVHEYPQAVEQLLRPHFPTGDVQCVVPPRLQQVDGHDLAGNMPQAQLSHDGLRLHAALALGPLRLGVVQRARPGHHLAPIQQGACPGHMSVEPGQGGHEGVEVPEVGRGIRVREGLEGEGVGGEVVHAPG